MRPKYMFDCKKCRQVELMINGLGVNRYCVPTVRHQQRFIWEKEKMYCNKYIPIEEVEQ